MPDQHARVTLREITAETLGSVLALSVLETQKGFVAPNAVSIAQAHFSENAWFRAIYADDTPVGFVMLWIDENTAQYDIWRFMVDHRYQRRGYGRQAMQQVIDFVRASGRAREISLSYVPGKGNPSPFYRKCGFAETGEWNEGEKVMKLEL